MKNKEQIKTDMIKYLSKTSNHLFMKENGDIYKILINNDDIIIIEGNKNYIIDLNKYIDWYGSNTKCVLKNRFFLNKKVKSIKNFKLMREAVIDIKNIETSNLNQVEVSEVINKIVANKIVNKS